MKDKHTDILSKKLHPRASAEVRNVVDEFSADLLIQSKTLARNDEIVLVSHVRKAVEVLQKRKRRTWRQELAMSVGGILIGTFLQGFITELAKNPMSGLWISIYVVLGIVGIILLFIGMLFQYGDSS